MKTFSFSTLEAEHFTPFPFNELILSWNGFRPKMGHWTIYIGLYRIHSFSWSPYLKYATWGATFQKTFQESTPNIHSHQDVVSAKNYANGFRYKIVAEEGATLETLQQIHVFCTDTNQPLLQKLPASSYSLKGIFPHSQMTLAHPRHRDLCSPTSTAAAINFLLRQKTVDPLQIAEQVHDSGFDIYGNWILNTAAAYEVLGGKYETYVARLTNFCAIHNHLKKNRPVIVSVKGTLPGAKVPYPNGHLMLIVGYDHEKRQVLCMDPRFDTEEETLVSYPIEAFLEAWGARRNLAYVFNEN